MKTSNSWNVFGIHKLDEILGLENPFHGHLSIKGEFVDYEGNQATIHNQNRVSSQHCFVSTYIDKHAI